MNILKEKIENIEEEIENYIFAMEVADDLKKDPYLNKIFGTRENPFNGLIDTLNEFREINSDILAEKKWKNLVVRLDGFLKDMELSVKIENIEENIKFIDIIRQQEEEKEFNTIGRLTESQIIRRW